MAGTDPCVPAPLFRSWRPEPWSPGAMVQRHVDMASSPSLAPVAFAVEWSERRAQGRSSPEKQKRVEEAPLRKAWVRKRAWGGFFGAFAWA